MRQDKSDYYNLQTELYQMYHRRRNRWVFLTISLVLGAVMLIYGILNKLPSLNIAITTLFTVFVAFLILVLSNLIWVNMNQSDYEEKMVRIGVAYFSRMRLSSKRIEIIGKRAEIGSGTLSIRIILPVFAIPFLITYFSESISSVAKLFILIAIILIGLSFILELDRANMDVLIRQIYVSYPTKEGKKTKKKQ